MSGQQLRAGVETAAMTEDCIFCDIVCGRVPASVVHVDNLTMAFVDLRQHNAGHVLVIPREHLQDVRELDEITGAALMATLVRITRAVGKAFPNDGLSLWHSIGPAAFQEVPHLHIHVHPRLPDDGALRIYPHAPATPDMQTRDDYAARVRAHL